jgi:hypothetical protein
MPKAEKVIDDAFTVAPRKLSGGFSKKSKAPISSTLSQRKKKKKSCLISKYELATKKLTLKRLTS